MLIGTPSLQFDVNHHWAQLPPNIQLGYTHGICVDVNDNVYVFNQSKHAVVLFSPDGTYLRSWGEGFQHGAHGMRLTLEGAHECLYLTDHDLHVVVKTTLRGMELFRLGVPPRKDIYAGPPEFKPTDVCIAPSGDFYVFDGYGKPYIHVFNRHGKYLQSIGGPGNGPGQLNCPHGGWVDTRKVEPELYVADRGNNRIQVFSLEGKFKRIISHPELKMPCGFYQFADELWVPDLQARLVMLDAHDQVAAVLGDFPEAPKMEGWPNIQDKLQEGKFSSPHTCCVDRHGDVYLVEWIGNGRISKLTRKSPAPVLAPRIN